MIAELFCLLAAVIGAVVMTIIKFALIGTAAVVVLILIAVLLGSFLGIWSR